MTRFKTVLRHSSYLFGSKILTRFLFTAFVVFAAARLGPELFGVLAFAMAMVELLSWFGDLGLTRYGARELVASGKDRAVLNGQLLLLQLTSSIVLCSLGLTVILLWSPPAPKFQLLIMGLVAVLLSGVVNATESALIASQNFFFSALLTFIGRVVFLTIGFIALNMGASVVAVMAGFLAGVVLESLLRLLVVAVRVSGFSFRFPLRDVMGMLMASLPFAAAAVTSVIYSQVGIVALEILRDDADVGVYSVAYSLFVPFVWVSVVLAKAMFPGMAELYKSDSDASRQNYRQWYRLLVMGGIPLAVGTSLVARAALSHFPSGYEESSSVLILLMWSVPILLISPTELNIMQIIGREKAAARALFVTMMVTVALQFVLVPFYGVVGAAVASISGAVVREIQFYEVVRRHFFMGKHYLVLFLRPALAGSVMALVALMAWGLGPWAATFLGLLGYVAALFVTGGLRISEIKALARS